MEDVVIERSHANRCPICDKEITLMDEVAVMEYKGQKILAHKEHVKK